MITLKFLLHYLLYLLSRLLLFRKPLGYQDWFYEGWLADDDEDFSQAWLCNCGDYIEDGLHCPICGHEPPWDCDCGMHDEEEYDAFDETSWYDDPYIAQSIYEAIEADEDYEGEPDFTLDELEWDEQYPDLNEHP